MPTPAWFVSLLKVFFPYRKPLARLSRLPLIGSIMEQVIFRDDEMVYLPKDRVVIREAIDQPGSIVLPSAIVEYFIEKADVRWIMNTCICREGDDCQDYPHDLGCIFLGEAAAKIDPRLGRLVTKEEALEHARKCREAGLVHLIGRDRLDSLWMGVGPSEKLMTICNCCPCCCLFRILPDLTPNISRRIKRLPGVEVWVGEECTGCGKCVRSGCFVEAISLVDGKAQISDACRGCGRCVEACSKGAIHLTIHDAGYLANTIRRISSAVDVDGSKPELPPLMGVSPVSHATMDAGRRPPAKGLPSPIVGEGQDVQVPIDG